MGLNDQAERMQELRDRLDKGLITKLGYVIEACEVLELENPIGVDRKWLANELGMSYTALTNQLHVAKGKGLI